MNYLEKVKTEHITNCPKVLAIIQEMQDVIDKQERRLSEWEQPVPAINLVDGVRNPLIDEAG